MTSFGDELRRLRKQVGMSQELLAANAGLSSEAVSLLERGRRTPRLTTLRLLADGMCLASLDRESFYGSAEPTTPDAAPLQSYPDQPWGRNVEIASVGELVEWANAWLITLLGPAGVGTSWIAAGSAATAAQRFPAGAHWSVAASAGAAGSPDPAPDLPGDHAQGESGHSDAAPRELVR